MNLDYIVERIKLVLVGVPLLAGVIIFIIGTILLILGLNNDFHHSLPDLPLEPTIIVPSGCSHC